MDELLTLHDEMRACRRCVDAGHGIVPGAIFRGELSSRLMLIGQAPGVTEVEAKRPFNANSGRRLFQWLGEAGWDEDDFRARHYMTAVTKCYPGKGKNGKGDRVPSRAEQALCRPFLEREIGLVKPQVMLLIGGLAIKLLFPKSAKLTEVIGTAVYFPQSALTNPVNFELDDGVWINEISTVQSQMIRVGENGRWVVPLPHPSGASLWPNKPANKHLIARSIQILGELRETYAL